MRAIDVVHFLGTLEMLQRLCQKKPISLVTAQQWLKRHGYRYTKEPGGQFVDGHERKDVREYQDGVFLPAFEKLEERTRKWVKDNNGGINVEVDPGGKRRLFGFMMNQHFMPTIGAGCVGSTNLKQWFLMQKGKVHL